MNCCDDFGNCTQGRDCPARQVSEQTDADTFGIEVLRVAVIIVVCAALALAGGLIGGLLWGWLA